MRRRDEDVADHVLFLQGRALHALAAPALALERVDGLALHVAGAADRDDHVLLGDQVLDVEVPLVGADLRAARVGVLLPDLEELLLDHAAELLRALQQRVEVLDARDELGLLLVELGAGEPREAAQRHVEDVVRLDLAELELLHQLRPGFLGVLRAADDRDDLVEVVERDQQALDDVQALLALALLEAGAPRDDVDLVVDVVADHLGEVQRARHAVDEREHDHAERVLQLRVLVELVQHDLRVRPALADDDQAHPSRVRSSGPGRRRCPSTLPMRDELADLLGEPRLVHLVRQLGDDDVRPPLRPSSIVLAARTRIEPRPVCRRR